VADAPPVVLPPPPPLELVDVAPAAAVALLTLLELVDAGPVALLTLPELVDVAPVALLTLPELVDVDPVAAVELLILVLDEVDAALLVDVEPVPGKGPLPDGPDSCTGCGPPAAARAESLTVETSVFTLALLVVSALPALDARGDGVAALPDRSTAVATATDAVAAALSEALPFPFFFPFFPPAVLGFAPDLCFFVPDVCFFFFLVAVGS